MIATTKAAVRGRTFGQLQAIFLDREKQKRPCVAALLDSFRRSSLIAKYKSSRAWPHFGQLQAIFLDREIQKRPCMAAPWTASGDLP